MREKGRADPLSLERRVAPCLVVRRDRADAEAVPRRDSPPLELEDPQAEPAGLRRAAGYLAVERVIREVGAGSVPACAVEPEQIVQVLVEGPCVGHSEARAGLAQAAFAAAELLAEVGAPRREEAVPAGFGHAEHGIRLPSPDAFVEQCRPADRARQLLERRDVEPQGFERKSKCRRSRRPLLGMVDGSELVAGPVTHEADDPQASAALHIQREDSDDCALRAVNSVERQFLVVAKRPPPGVRPLPGREDPTADLSAEASPFGGERLECLDPLDAR